MALQWHDTTHSPETPAVTSACLAAVTPALGLHCPTHVQHVAAADMEASANRAEGLQRNRRRRCVRS